MKFLRTLFNALNTRIGGICKNEQCISQEIKNPYIDFDTSNASIVNRNILLQSPKISFKFNQYTDDNLFYERLCSSPMEGIIVKIISKSRVKSHKKYVNFQANTNIYLRDTNVNIIRCTSYLLY